MAEAEDPRVQLVRDVLDSYKDEYKELCENWRSLESKAQATTTACGIFLAGTLGFAHKLTSTSTCLEIVLLIATVTLLSLAVIFALLVLVIREVPCAPDGDSLDKMVNDLLGAEDGMLPERQVNFVNDHAKMWKTVNRGLEQFNLWKAFWLFISQCLLFGAVAGASALTISKALEYA